MNTLRPEFSVGSDGRLTSFAVLQTATASHPVLRPHRIAIGLYDRTGAGLTRRQRLEVDIAGERSQIPALAGTPRPDLVLVNDDDLSYAKVRLDDHSLRTLIDGIGSFTEQLPAALCWSAAWDMCRDAELAARDYVSLVLSGADSITDISVTQTVLAQAGAAARRFADPAWRDAGLERIAAALRELLQRAEPGSDRQLAYAQAFAGAAAAPSDLGLLAGLLAGTTAIDGLAVDTEFRWRLLRRLVSRGAAGPADIDAELARDATDAGARHAATCRAAVPTPEAKEAAWAEITGGTLANATFRAMLAGFADPDQDDLLKPYSERFFDMIAGIWAGWSSDMAQYFAKAAYPYWIVTRQAISAADDYLASTDPPVQLRRLLLEGRDDVARALRCRERDRLASG